MIDRYLKDVVPTRNGDENRQNTYLGWWRKELGPYLLSDITPSRIAHGRDRLLSEVTYRGKKRSNATVVRYMAALSTVYTSAINEWGWVESSPLKKVKKPKEPRGRIRFLDEKEREALLAVCQKSECRYLYLIVVMAISTGMRRGEIRGLRWRDVDLQKGRIVLEKTKNEEARAVPLVGKAHALLSDLAKRPHEDDDLLFPGRKSSIPVEFHKAFISALEEAKIKNFRFHDLRHTAASYLAMNGATLAELADVLGHKTLAMVKRYAHLSEAHTSKVVERMNETIFGG
jgi:integrase